MKGILVNAYFDYVQHGASRQTRHKSVAVNRTLHHTDSRIFPDFPLHVLERSNTAYSTNSEASGGTALYFTTILRFSIHYLGPT